MQTTDFINILGMRVDMVQIADVISKMKAWIKGGSYGNYIIIYNANDVVAGKKDIKAKEAVNHSSLSVPDGFSMLLLAKIYGYDLKERVYGPDLMIEFFKSDCNREYSHFFYGSIPSTLNQLRERLNLKFSNLEIAGFYSPPFRTLTEKEDAEIIKMINASCPDVLWVGLGCPKQQLWMHEHKDSLKVPVMIGVGAAFDFLAGTKKQAPRWMQRSGLEWLFRLLTEPKRLWRRYILGYAFFLYLICRELINGKLCLNLRKI